MNESLFDSTALISNSIGGIVSGLTVAVVLAIYLKLRKALLRRDQIRYFSGVISKGIEDITNAGQREDISISGPNVALTPDQLRHLYYTEMRRILDSAADWRSSEITYDEIQELRQALQSVNWTIDNHGMVPEGLYDSTISALRAVRWLRINVDVPVSGDLVSDGSKSPNSSWWKRFQFYKTGAWVLVVFLGAANWLMQVDTVSNFTGAPDVDYSDGVKASVAPVLPLCTVSV